MLLSREAFLLIDDSDTDFVELPEYRKNIGEECPKVRVRSLMSDQRQRLYEKSREIREKGIVIPGGINALCCAMGMIDEKGILMFPSEVDGAAAIGRRHPEVVARIANRIYELSDMTKTQRLENEKKLLKTTPSDSASGSVPESTPDTAST